MAGMWQASKSHPPAGGFQRFTLDMPLEDHCRFKSLCAMRQTTMRAEIQALVAAQLSAPDVMLSEVLTELVEQARAQGTSLSELLKGVLGQIAEKSSGPKLVRPA
jgi:hypothetical protein